MSGIRSDTGPFTLTPEWVLDAEISDRAVRLYGVLGRYADDEGKAHPSRRTLADRLRCSVDSIDRAVRELVDAKALQVSARLDGAGDQTSNEYLLARVRPGGRKAAATPLGKGAATGGRTGAAQNENQVEREETLAAAPEARPRDEVWDALEEAFGAVAEKTNAHARRNKAIADLKRLGCTSRAEILAARALWPVLFPGATLTDVALATHYPQLVQRQAPREPEPVAKLVGLPDLTEEEREANLKRARSMVAGIGKDAA